MRYLLIIFFVFPFSTAAATLDLLLHPESEGSRIVSFRIDTDGENINAVEGVLGVPEGLVVRDIVDGDSFINFWIERPKLENGEIRFSGITPGGYAGSGRELFAVVVDATPGAYTFELAEARALKNDGEGTAMPLSLGETIADGTLYDLTDTTPPEPFTITRGTDFDLFDGQLFVVFATQDKQSGIQRYEVAYSWIPLGSFAAILPWRDAVSPLPLERDSYIYIRAIDAAGNSRLAALSPEGGVPLPVYIIGFGILLIFAVRVLYYVFARTRR